MKKTIILLPFLLSGCFMYDNLKCSFQGNCPDTIISEQEETARLNELNNKAEKMIVERCSKLYGYKKGTLNYMRCQEMTGESYRIDVKYEGVEEAYRKLKNAFAEQEMTCEDYGFKKNSKNYIICIKELEEKYLRLEAAKAASEAQSYRNRVNCTTQTLFGTTYTNCY